VSLAECVHPAVLIPVPRLSKAASVSDVPANEVVADADLAAVERMAQACQQISSELSRSVIGQRQVIEELLVALFSGGHCLLVGVPGLAKTLMVRTLAETLSLSFNRVQFTPDLMPSDITGTEVIQEDRSTGVREFRFIEGPIFTNVLLADEINRTPPKTQAALLEAMQEHQVTAGGRRHRLPEPFFVLATQNPIEQEGTYPLPEAQLDRFMFQVFVDYPEADEEFQIVRQTTSTSRVEIHKVLSFEEIQRLQETVRRIPVADHVIRYAMQFARLTRRGREEVPDFVTRYVSWGAGPRASQALILGAKARAMLRGRPYVSTEDVRAIAAPVLRHRIVTNFNAEADGVSADTIVAKLAELIPAGAADPSVDDRIPPVFRGA